MSSRARTLWVCSALVILLIATAVLAPLPFTVVVPGLTADTLGSDHGRPVISVTGTQTRRTRGKLLLTTIAATEPDASVRLTDVVRAWFDEEQAALPRSAVYPAGESTKEIEKHNAQEMAKSQNAATAAVLKRLGLSPRRVHVRLSLADVGGPSAGLMFSLGILDKVHGDGHGGDLTGGRTVAGTGTITADGKIGPVGGIPLKEQAAKRDGATVFLVPAAECADAKAERPKGLRLIAVSTLDDAVRSLTGLDSGGRVPSC